MFPNVVGFEANGIHEHGAVLSLSLALALAPGVPGNTQNGDGSHDSELNIYGEDLDSYEPLHDEHKDKKEDKSGHKSRMAKRSNFQFTYDSDNHLLDLIYRHKDELFTRGNTTKTWNSVLDEFNLRFDSKILQTRTINNRFKTLRKNLETKLIREQNPVNELNLNENENLLVYLNEYLNKKKKSSKGSKSLSSDSVSSTSVVNKTAPKIDKVKTESIPLTPNHGHIAENTTPFSQEQKFVQIPVAGYPHHEPLDHHIDPIMTSGQSYYGPTNPILHSSHPTKTNINIPPVAPVAPVAPPPPTSLFYPNQTTIPPGMVSNFPPSGTSSLNQTKPSVEVGAEELIKPTPQRHYSEESGLRKRLRSTPSNSNSQWMERFWTSQNELTSQVGELRKEMDLFRNDVDSKLRNMLNNINHNNESISMKINNLYDVLDSKKELDMKLDKVSKVLDLANQYQNPPLQQHHINLNIPLAPNNPDLHFDHP